MAAIGEYLPHKHAIMGRGWSGIGLESIVVSAWIGHGLELVLGI